MANSVMRPVDPHRVGELVRAVAREEMLPRFGKLAAHEVHAKPTDGVPDDIVTDADLAVERRLVPELVALVPRSLAIGEEGAAQDASVLTALVGSAPTWLVDPLDGTRNFAAGREDFGTMVALVVRGETVMSWIYLPVTDELFVAERGAGATLDGRRLVASDGAGDETMAGVIYGQVSMPRTERDEIIKRATGRYQRAPALHAACAEYTSLVLGRRAWVVYHRLLAWDHASGALLLEEAGGAARHVDGSPYRPTHENRTLLLARSASLWPGVRDALFGD